MSFIMPILDEMFPWYLQILQRSSVFPILIFSSFFFFCIAHLKRPSYLFLLFPGTLHSVGYIFPFLLCLSLFFPQLFNTTRWIMKLFPNFGWASYQSVIHRSCWHIYSATGSVQFSSVQSLSRVRLFATPWITARQASLSITNSRSSLRLASIKSVMPSSHLILCRPLLLLPPIPPSISLFQWVNSSHEVAKVLEFQL